MTIQYKGYIIRPNSHELPDGKWLPVAELEMYHGGSTHVKPPVRAKPHEARMTKVQADQAAIEMAKQWIDAKG